MHQVDTVIIGSGMGSLTAACLLAKEGKKIALLEQNWIIGGCTSSYWRKGFVFESGATTLVGLDQEMPLRYLLDELGLTLPAIELELPMQVYLKDGTVINRYKDINRWIEEAERVFGKKNQAAFWKHCYRISQFVWKTSLRQTAFPPTRLTDLFLCAKRATLEQLWFARYALRSMKSLLRQYGLLDNQRFVEFVDEQLLITAQNYHDEVNVLFGATALCYTNYGNYYVEGGLINLVKPLADYLEAQGSKIYLRHEVKKITYREGERAYEVICKVKGKEEQLFSTPLLVSGIPINNTLELLSDERLAARHQSKVMTDGALNSAFQMGIGFEPTRPLACIHHQIHLEQPMPHIDSASIFVSFSHPADRSRSDLPNAMVASVSTHVRQPAANRHLDKAVLENFVMEVLEQRGFLERSKIIYYHSSSPAAWEKWTLRKYGFVGGYPQYKHIKPWQMIDSRLDGKGLYLCGDTTYPGQGIPGATLSGIIAYEKIKSDGK